jgi:hypothetical protein
MSDRSIAAAARLGAAPTLGLATWLLLALAGCSGTSSTTAPEDDAGAEFASLRREADSLLGRRTALDRELERITGALDGWSKRNKVGVPTQQLVLSLLSRSLEPHLGSDAHHAASGQKPSAFERDYAEIEHAMARAMHERTEIDRATEGLNARLTRFKVDPQPAEKTQQYKFGDVFMPIPGLGTSAARKSCDSYVLDLRPGELCVLTREECEALDPARPTGGWVQICTYTCYGPMIGTGPLRG